MSLEQLTAKAIHAHSLDTETTLRILRLIKRGTHLTPEEYEALQSLDRALKCGEVVREGAAPQVAHA